MDDAFVSQLDKIQDDLRLFDVEGLIQRFDVEIDVPLRHDLCLGLLQVKRAQYARGPQSDLKRLATFVGAHWCRVIAHDVLYELAESLDVVRLSTAEAEELGQRIRTSRVAAADLEFPAYALARWYDGAGKAYYRVARYSEACLAIRQAVEIAERFAIWWILPDLNSNLVRAEAEAQAKAAPSQRAAMVEQADMAFHMQLALTRQQAAEHEGFDIWLAQPDQQMKPAARLSEFARGYSSLLHNHAWLLLQLRSPDFEGSLSQSKLAEKINRALHDDYRLGQTVLHQILLEQKRNNADGALQLTAKALDTMRWQRGRRILAQQHAKLTGILAPDGLARGAQAFEQLFGEFARMRRARGGEFGLDTDVEVFTVNAFREMFVERLRRTTPEVASSSFDPRSRASFRDVLERLGLSEQLVAQHAATVDREELAAMRAQRRVITVSQYKSAFAKLVRPLFLEHIGNLLGGIETDSHQLIELIALVEECSARELLDMLRMTANPPKSTGDALAKLRRDHFVPIGVHDARVVDASASRGDTSAGIEAPARRGQARRSTLGRRGGSDQDDEVGEKRLHAFARWAEDHPLQVAENDPEIGHAISRLTANLEDACIVRFFGYGSEVNVGSQRLPKLGALVYRGDRVTSVTEEQCPDFSLARVYALQRAAVARHGGEGPDVELCRALWDAIIDPLLCHVVGPEKPDGSNWPKLLTLIPSDSLFAVPLHAAMSPQMRPLCAHGPTCYSASGAAFVTRGRWMLTRQFVSASDDLCAVVLPDQPGLDPISGEDISGIDWPSDHFWIVGKQPQSVSAASHFKSEGENPLRRGLEVIEKIAPEFFVYAGHGDQQNQEIGPYILLDGDDRLYWYDIAQHMRLPHNKLTLLSACVSGAGADSGGGEVAGFVRAFIAAGAGALGVTLWSVYDDLVSKASRALLRDARRAASHSEPFRCVDSLHAHYRGLADDCDDPQELIEACGLALYL